VFGVPAERVERPLPEFPREDLGLRHLWYRCLHDLAGFPWLAALLALAGGAFVLLAIGARWWVAGLPPAPPASRLPAP
jgi:hypothetical protein